jgi:hypothetical protein
MARPAQFIHVGNITHSLDNTLVVIILTIFLICAGILKIFYQMEYVLGKFQNVIFLLSLLYCDILLE